MPAASVRAQPAPDYAALLERMAVQLMRSGRPAEAAEAARAAVAERPPGSDALLRARALATQGEIERDLDRFDAARAALDESLALRQAALPAGDVRLADNWQKLGALEMSLGRPDLAAEHYARTLHLLESGAARTGDAVSTRIDLAAACIADGQLENAERQLLTAQALLPAVAEVQQASLRAEWLQRRGELLQRRGALREAQSLFDQALATRRDATQVHPLDLAATLAAGAENHLVAGRYREALQAQREAADLFEGVRGRRHTDIARSEMALAEIHRAAGDIEAALERLQRALEIRRERLPPQHPDIGRSLNGLGLALLEAGRIPQAIEAFDGAMVIFGARRGLQIEQASAMHNRAAAAYRQGDFAAAEAGFARAGEVWREAAAGEHYLALSIGQRAEALDALQRHAAAEPLHEEAVAMLLAAGDAPLELAAAFARLAEHHAARGGAPQAIFFGKESVRRLQQLRIRWDRADAGLQRSFLRQRQDVYQRLATRLIAAGRLFEAEQVLQALKEGELHELVRGGDASASTSVDFVGKEGAAAREGEVLGGDVQSAREYEELAPRESQLDERGRARYEQLKALKLRLRANFQRWVHSVREALARTPPPDGVASTDAVANMPNRTKEFRAALKADPGSVAVHYVVTDQQIAILFVTPQDQFGRFVDVPREQLYARIAELRQAIRDRGNVMPAARALYRWLIAPIEADLAQAQARTLVLSLTGNLRYVPFAALHDGQRYLIERMPVAVWAAAGAPAPAGTPAAAWQVAAMGASRGGPTFSPLPAVPTELRSIVADDGRKDGGILPGRILLDEQFDQTAFVGALTHFNVAHVASHFDFKPGDESRSVLLLGDGQTISLGQIAVLPFDNVQLLALSACNTATGGGVNENGAEVEGLAAAVQNQGARSVLASLWSVSDGSTARLMTAFYAHRERGLAQALREAQLRLLRGQAEAAPDAIERGVRIAGGAPATGWSHPFYWAPFVLSGQWR